MSTEVIQLRNEVTTTEVADSMIAQITGGEIDPLKAYITISKIEKAIEMVKKHYQAREAVMNEFDKYGSKSYQFGDCKVERAEVGTKYDYSVCNDSKLNDMRDLMADIAADIKEREDMLKVLPASGMGDPETGEVLYPPVKTSTTSLKLTFKK